MIFGVMPVGPFQANCYLLGCHDTHEALVIDPGDNPEQIEAWLSEQQLTPVAYLHTHGHIDHVGATAPLKARFDGKILLHRADLFLYEHAHVQALSYGFQVPRTVSVDRFIDDGEEITWGQARGRILHTPGHSPGGVCLHVAAEVMGPMSDVLDSPAMGDQPADRRAPSPGKTERAGDADWVFTGDTLFMGSIGRTDLPGGSHAELLSVIHAKLLPLADATVVASGHGPLTTIGRERRMNPFLQGGG